MPNKSQILKALEAAQAGYKKTDMVPLSGSLLLDIIQMLKGRESKVKLEQAKQWLRLIRMTSIDDDTRLYCDTLLEALADKGEAK